MELTPSKTNYSLPNSLPTQPPGDELAKLFAASLGSQGDHHVFKTVLTSYFNKRGIHLTTRDMAILLRGIENLIGGVLKNQTPAPNTKPTVTVVDASHIKPFPPLLTELDIIQLPIEKSIKGFQKKINVLDKGPLKKVNAIVLHQTNTALAKITFRVYKKRTFGPHYTIGIDGTIYQHLPLDRRTAHVGRIKSRCSIEVTCSKKEKVFLANVEAKATSRGSVNRQIASHERRKSYPDRYPRNDDSIGIEVVGLFDKQKKSYGKPTKAQKKSLDKLVKALMDKYRLTIEDVYIHGAIGDKQESEAAFLGY